MNSNYSPFRCFATQHRRSQLPNDSLLSLYSNSKQSSLQENSETWYDIHYSLLSKRIIFIHNNENGRRRRKKIIIWNRRRSLLQTLPHRMQSSRSKSQQQQNFAVCEMCIVKFVGTMSSFIEWKMLLLLLWVWRHSSMFDVSALVASVAQIRSI